MRIVLVTPYASYPGGVECMNSLLAKVISSLGIELKLVTADNQSPHSLLGRIEYRIVGAPSLTARRACREIKEDDLVICNGEFGYGIESERSIDVFHGSYGGYRRSLGPFLGGKQNMRLLVNEHVQRLSARGKHTVAVSDFLRNVLRACGIPVDEVIVNPIDSSLFHPGNEADRHNLLFVGSYDRFGKGFDILESLASRGHSIDCVTNREPGSGLAWVRNAKYAEMASIYRKHRILVFPSRFEGCGLAPLEAMACGVPVIMGKTGIGCELSGVIPEFVVDGFSPESVDEYERRIAQINDSYDGYCRKAIDYVCAYHPYKRFYDSWKSLIERFF